jgi:hypothetical protein
MSLFAELGTYTRFGSHLTELQRILAIIVAVRDVHYGWTHNAPLARAVGITEAQLLLLKEGRTPKDLALPERALCDYAFEITLGRRVPARVAEEVHAHFVPRQIVDIALLTVYYMSLTALAIGLDVQIEPPETLQFELQWHMRQADGPGNRATLATGEKPDILAD